MATINKPKKKSRPLGTPRRGGYSLLLVVSLMSVVAKSVPFHFKIFGSTLEPLALELTLGEIASIGLHANARAYFGFGFPFRANKGKTQYILRHILWRDLVESHRHGGEDHILKC